MSVRQRFFETMRQRRKFPAGSPDREYLTRTARKYVWLMRGKPTSEWSMQ